MTKKEKADPNIIKASRKIRISKGSGTRVQDVNKLLKQFLQSQKMMKKMKSMGKGGLPSDFMNKLQGKLPPNLNWFRKEKICQLELDYQEGEQKKDLIIE